MPPIERKHPSTKCYKNTNSKTFTDTKRKTHFNPASHTGKLHLKSDHALTGRPVFIMHTINQLTKAQHTKLHICHLHKQTAWCNFFLLLTSREIIKKRKLEKNSATE